MDALDGLLDPPDTAHAPGSSAADDVLALSIREHSGPPSLPAGDDTGDETPCRLVGRFAPVAGSFRATPLAVTFESSRHLPRQLAVSIEIPTRAVLACTTEGCILSLAVRGMAGRGIAFEYNTAADCFEAAGALAKAGLMDDDVLSEAEQDDDTGMEGIACAVLDESVLASRFDFAFEGAGCNLVAWERCLRVEGDDPPTPAARLTPGIMYVCEGGLVCTPRRAPCRAPAAPARPARSRRSAPARADLPARPELQGRQPRLPHHQGPTAHATRATPRRRAAAPPAPRTPGPWRGGRRAAAGERVRARRGGAGGAALRRHAGHRRAPRGAARDAHALHGGARAGLGGARPRGARARRGAQRGAQRGGARRRGRGRRGGGGAPPPPPPPPRTNWTRLVLSPVLSGHVSSFQAAREAAEEARGREWTRALEGRSAADLRADPHLLAAVAGRERPVRRAAPRRAAPALCPAAPLPLRPARDPPLRGARAGARSRGRASAARCRSAARPAVGLVSRAACARRCGCASRGRTSSARATQAATRGGCCGRSSARGGRCWTRSSRTLRRRSTRTSRAPSPPRTFMTACARSHPSPAPRRRVFSGAVRRV